MSKNFLKLGIVFAVIILAGAIGFNHFMGAQADYTKEDIEQIVKEYIEENPNIIVDSFERYRNQQQLVYQQQQREKVLAHKDKLLASETSPAIGSDADDAIVIVEFFDYNCGYCKRAIDAVNTIIKEEKDVRFVFKEFPILSPSSKTAAEYALASREQGKYIEYHTLLMKHQGNKDEKTLLDLAKKAGLDVEKLKKDAQAPKIQEELDNNRALAQSIDVRGTPAFIVGNQISPGYIPLEQMKQLIEIARQKS